LYRPENSIDEVYSKEIRLNQVALDELRLEAAVEKAGKADKK
jgi:hypothetical protein